MPSKRAVIAGISFALFTLLSRTQGATQPEYWKGKLDINIYDFTELTELRSTSGDRTSPSYHVVEITNRKYDVYQDPQGIVRRELAYTSRNRPLGQPMDINLLNYKEGYHLTFDKAGSQVEKSPLTPPLNRVPLNRDGFSVIHVRAFNTSGSGKVSVKGDKPDLQPTSTLGTPLC